MAQTEILPAQCELSSPLGKQKELTRAPEFWVASVQQPDSIEGPTGGLLAIGSSLPRPG